jgi:LPS export ABC transporter protein LptC
MMSVVFSAACTDTGVRPPTVAQDADTSDQRLIKMSTKITSDGVLRSFVEADTSYLYQRTQLMDLRHFTARLFDEQGNLKSTLRANRGIYTTYSGKLDARGKVVIVSTDGRRLQTEHLIYDKNANQIRSDTTFVYESATVHGTGNGFLSDVDFKNVTVDKPKGFQKGRGALLPGQ